MGYKVAQRYTFLGKGTYANLLTAQVPFYNSHLQCELVCTLFAKRITVGTSHPFDNFCLQIM